MTQYDVVIIGGGAAGLAAGLQLGRVRRSVVVIDSGAPRNAPAGSLHSYLGHDGQPPAQLLADGCAEVERYGGVVRAGTVVSVEGDVTSGFTVVLAGGGRIGGRRLVLATGITDVLPDVPGLAGHWGDTVVHCPFCHGWEVRDRRIVVLDTAGLGAHQALLFSQLSDDVTVLVHDGPGPDESSAADLAVLGVPIVHARALAVETGAAGALAALRLDAEPSDPGMAGSPGRPGPSVPVDGSVASDVGPPVLAADVVVVAPAFRPNLDGLDGLALALEDHPSGLGQVVRVDEHGVTGVPGVYAVGNLTDPSQQLLQAAAQGSRTGGLVSAHLVLDDVARRRRSQADASSWDERYGIRDGSMWSGAPNGSLVAELTGTAPDSDGSAVRSTDPASASGGRAAGPIDGAVGAVAAGRALDVGCGEGADAIWLAQRGWRVTAVDISEVAIERARSAGGAAGVEVDWRVADVLESPPEAQAFDLVSIQYPALLVAAGREAVARLLDAVAPGGILLAVGHALPHDFQPHDGGFDPADYTGVDSMAALFPDDFDVEVCEVRPRPNPPPGAHHVDDFVLRARRRPA